MTREVGFGCGLSDVFEDAETFLEVTLGLGGLAGVLRLESDIFVDRFDFVTVFFVRDEPAALLRFGGVLEHVFGVQQVLDLGVSLVG